MNVFSTNYDNYLSLGLKCDKSDNVTFIEFNYQVEKWVYSLFVSLFYMWRNGCVIILYSACWLFAGMAAQLIGNKINECIRLKRARSIFSLVVYMRYYHPFRVVSHGASGNYMRFRFVSWDRL